MELLEGYLQTLDPGEDLVAWGVRLRAAGFTTPARLQSATVEEVMAAGVTPRPLAALMVRGVVAGVFLAPSLTWPGLTVQFPSPHTSVLMRL